MPEFARQGQPERGIVLLSRRAACLQDRRGLSRDFLVPLAGPSGPEFVIPLDAEFVQDLPCPMDLAIIAQTTSAQEYNLIVMITLRQMPSDAIYFTAPLNYGLCNSCMAS